MDKRKSIINGLEQFIADFKPFCGNKADWQKVYNAIAMLKAQEPRVLTLEELKTLPDETDVWLEEFCSIVVAATVSHHWNFPNSEVITYFYGIESADYNSGNYMNADYGKEWRCWTSRPSYELQKVTKWLQ